MAPEEEYRRTKAAQKEEQLVLAPYYEWIAKTDLMFAKVKVVVSPDGSTEVTKEYPPAIQKGVNEMLDVMALVKAAIWAYHFPNLIRLNPSGSVPDAGHALTTEKP